MEEADAWASQYAPSVQQSHLGRALESMDILDLLHSPRYTEIIWSEVDPHVQQAAHAVHADPASAKLSLCRLKALQQRIRQAKL